MNLYYINKKVNTILKQYIDVEVERFANNMVTKIIHEKITDIDASEYLIINKNTSGDIEKISYDTKALNNLKNNITKEVQQSLTNLDNGDVSEYFIPKRIKYGRFKKIKNGIICDITMGSINNTSIFANIGPAIPLKLTFNNQINSDIDIKIKEYGINNVMMEVYLIITIKEQIIMPLSSERKDITVREPISVDIIRGEIPKYYNNF